MRITTPAQAEQQPLALSSLEIPNLGPGQVRLRVSMCGVCHTDLHILEGDIHPPKLPITPGHQVVGVVEALGKGVEGQVQIGARVGVPWLHL